MENEGERPVVVLIAILLLMVLVGQFTYGFACGAMAGLILGMVKGRERRSRYALLSTAFAFIDGGLATGSLIMGCAAAVISVLTFYPAYALGKVDLGSEESPCVVEPPRSHRDEIIMHDDRPDLERLLRKSHR